MTEEPARSERAAGPAQFAAPLLGGLIVLLVAKKVITADEARELIDQGLLAVEESHAERADHERPEADHARVLYEALLAEIAAADPSPKPSGSP